MFEVLVDYSHMAMTAVSELYQIYSKVVLLQFAHSQIYPLGKLRSFPMEFVRCI